MQEFINFKSMSLRVDSYGKLTEKQFIDKFAHSPNMFGFYGEKRDKILKEAYRLIKNEYDKKNKKDEKEIGKEAPKNNK